MPRHLDDLKYESKYKELRKKVKIVEEVRIHSICTPSAYFILTAVTKCRTMTSYMQRFSKRSTTSSGCDSNERESLPAIPLLSHHCQKLPTPEHGWPLDASFTHPRRWRAADLVLYPRVPRPAYAPLHAYGISISLKPPFGRFLCSIHIPFYRFLLDNSGRPTGVKAITDPTFSLLWQLCFYRQCKDTGFPY